MDEINYKAICPNVFLKLVLEKYTIINELSSFTKNLILCLCSEHTYLMKNQPHIFPTAYEPKREMHERII